MPRPRVDSEENEQRDKAGLGVMLDRVRDSTWRPANVKKKLIFHLQEAFKLMIEYDRREYPKELAKTDRKRARSAALEVAADEMVKRVAKRPRKKAA